MYTDKLKLWIEHLSWNPPLLLLLLSVKRSSHMMYVGDRQGFCLSHLLANSCSSWTGETMTPKVCLQASIPKCAIAYPGDCVTSQPRPHDLLFLPILFFLLVETFSSLCLHLLVLRQSPISLTDEDLQRPPASPRITTQRVHISRQNGHYRPRYDSCHHRLNGIFLSPPQPSRILRICSPNLRPQHRQDPRPHELNPPNNHLKQHSPPHAP